MLGCCRYQLAAEILQEGQLTWPGLSRIAPPLPLLLAFCLLLLFGVEREIAETMPETPCMKSEIFLIGLML